METLLLILSKILQPWFFPLGLMILTLIFLRRILRLRKNPYRKKIRLALLLIILIIYSLSIRPVSDTLIGFLEQDFPTQQKLSVGVRAILVLSSDSRNAPNAPATFQLGPENSLRTLEALRLWQTLQQKPFILVSGGNNIPMYVRKEAVADAMKRFFTDFGVSPDKVLTEKKARNTYENFSLSQEILINHGINVKKQGQVVVISSGYHLKRSRLIARRLGWQADFLPANSYQNGHPIGLADFFPSSYSFHLSTVAIREILGLTYYRMRGYL